MRWAHSLDAGDEEAGDAVLDLQRDAADVAADERARLPDRLGDRQPEALAGGLLDQHVGVRLERVDLDRADVVEVVEDVYVRVAVGVGDRRVEEVPALGVVAGHRADQRELHLGHRLLDEAVGVDHAERVLPGVEARDLADQRPVDVDPELPAHERAVLGRERHVLRRQRVDRRRHHVDVAVHPLRHVLAHVEQRLRVLLDVGQQLADRVRVGRRQVDVAAPHPALGLLGHQLAQRRRLRVVHQAHVPAAGQLARVDLVVAAPGRPLLLVEILGRALQRVVHQLGRVEELFAAVDHLPLAVQADVAHQRHERVQDLRDAAAERGRRDVHHALALQRLGQLADLGDQLAAADVRVVGERLVGDGDGLEHAAARYLTRRSNPATRASCNMRLRPRSRSERCAREPAGGLWSTGMLNARLYRAAFVPFLLALAIAAFSLGSRPAPLRSTLAPDAFEGARAYAELQQPRQRSFPKRRAGQRRRRSAGRATSPRDARRPRRHGRRRLLGAHLHFDAQTIDGERTLSDGRSRSVPARPAPRRS